MTEVDSYPAMDNPNHDFYVVGIGASAGGLEALEKLFDALPADSGFAFVIVQHLSPDFKSLMSELLSRHTSMKVCQASDGMPVEPDHLYLMPPDQIVRMRGRHLECTPKPKPKTLSLPIDDFLTSLATDIGDKAIAVVLSGTGSDGSRGIARVHDAGGLVIVQSIESAKFDGMPRNAIDTHCVDAVAPPDQIAAMLMRYAAQPNRSRIASPPVSESSLQTVFRLLNERHRIDFQDYKPNTITRRIERRVQLMHDEDLSHYAARLDSDPEEIDRLYRDLLIGVTQLFRDTEAFKCFRDEVLVDLLSRQPTGEEFRVWVSACATGEEAVSIAISINETMRDLNLSFPVKIFATDVHAASLRVAHAGLYPKSHLKGINRAIAKRYFRPLGEQIQISPDIRQMLVFAPHDLLKDAPFTRLHLVTCRNLLIYLQPPAQKRVLSVLHFGLLPGGVMFLGGSENTSSMSDYFEVVSERHRLYRKPQHFGGGEKPKLPEIRSWLGVNRSTLPPAPDDSVTHDAVSEAINRTEPAGYETRQPWTALYEELLGRYMPAALLVDSDLQVLHTFGGAGKFLRFIDGRVTANLEDMLDG
ncbi:MAG: chemotaxis protein CheB, partial [Planctomycetota bacterium]